MTNYYAIMALCGLLYYGGSAAEHATKKVVHTTVHATAKIGHAIGHVFKK